jgi:hypothetical protein
MTGTTKNRGEIWAMEHKRIFFCTPQTFKNDVCTGTPHPTHSPPRITAVQLVTTLAGPKPVSMPSHIYAALCCCLPPPPVLMMAGHCRGAGNITNDTLRNALNAMDYLKTRCMCGGVGDVYCGGRVSSGNGKSRYCAGHQEDGARRAQVPRHWAERHSGERPESNTGPAPFAHSL